MKKFTNPFNDNENYINLKKALVEWVFGTDGMNGATGEVLGQIPWTEEMDSLISWDKVDRKFDEAIGHRGDWDVYRLTSPLHRNTDYRGEFDMFISKKAVAISKVYDEIVEKLNSMNKKCVVVEKCIGVEDGFCKYKIIERFYADTYLESINKIYDKYVKDSMNNNWYFAKFVDAVYKGSVHIYGDFHCHLDDYLTNGKH